MTSSCSNRLLSINMWLWFMALYTEQKYSSLCFFFTVQKRLLNRSDSALVWWRWRGGGGGRSPHSFFYDRKKKKNGACPHVCTCFWKQAFSFVFPNKPIQMESGPSRTVRRWKRRGSMRSTSRWTRHWDKKRINVRQRRPTRCRSGKKCPHWRRCRGRRSWTSERKNERWGVRGFFFQLRDKKNKKKRRYLCAVCAEKAFRSPAWYVWTRPDSVTEPRNERVASRAVK